MSKRSFHGLSSFLDPRGGGAIALLMLGCTAKLGTINPNQPMTGETHQVVAVSCKPFTWPYGKSEDLKQQTIQKLQSQANSYARIAHAQEAELINVTISKQYWPWFYWLLGGVCVKAEGFARPKTQ
ncbi:hypothetical protein [Helicobacter suis]|uniref:hypothetical protein n=1 Tax=Helicobacter suis TaxID=104628 RepID=UPI0015970C64|nr:hypothetical protein [Helicobacter suis]